MYDEIGKVSQRLLDDFDNLNGEDKYLTLMGKYAAQISNEEIFAVWKISGFSMNDLLST